MIQFNTLKVQLFQANLIVITLFGFLTAQPAIANTASKPTVGYVEYIELESGDFVKVKFATGVISSSINAEDVTYFTKDGSPWVSFVLAFSYHGNLVRRKMEKPLFRRVEIASSGQSMNSVYPVVVLNLCFNGSPYQESFILKDRNNLIYAAVMRLCLVVVF